MATTSPDGIVSPDSDQPVDWVGDWAATASSVQTALSNRAVKTGTTAQRNSATGVQEGTLWYDTTTGVTYRYTSGSWIAVTLSNTTETLDASSAIAPGFSGSITMYRRGGFVTMYASISATSGSLGPSSSSIFLAAIPSGWRPIANQTAGARTVQSGSGYAGGFLLLSTGGNLSIQGHRNGDNQVQGGMTYMLA